MRIATRNALLGVMLVCMSCSGRVEEGPPPGLSETYADVLLYRSDARSRDSASYAAGIDSVLAAHGYDRSSFAAAFERIGTSADQVNEFFDSTSVHLLPPSRE